MADEEQHTNGMGDSPSINQQLDMPLNSEPEHPRDDPGSDGSRDISWVELFDEIPNSLAIRIISVVIIIFSIIEASIGGAIFNFMFPFNTRYGIGYGTGAWWGSLVSLAAAVIAFIACIFDDVKMLVAAGFLSFFAIGPAIVGAVWDGAALAVIKTIRSCLSPPDPAHSGSFQCVGNPCLCGNITLTCTQLAPYYLQGTSFINDDTVFPSIGTCYCSDGDICYILTLQKFTIKPLNYGCRNVTNLYADELATSIAFCALIAILSMFLSGTILNSLCCFGSAGFIEHPLSLELFQPPHRPLITTIANTTLPRDRGDSRGNYSVGSSSISKQPGQQL